MIKSNEIVTFGEVEPEVMKQMEAACNEESVRYGVLCSDNHIGYSLPVGSVVAFEKAICVNGVGYDIACGNKAVRLDCKAEEIKKDIYRIMNEIQSKISFGMGRRNNEKVDHEIFIAPIWNDIDVLKPLLSKARDQFGTVGGGNHYVDVFIDESNRIWIGVHFGSRGLGHTIASHFVKAGEGVDGVHAKPVIFNEDSDLGQQYIRCMELAGRYAYAGRDWVCSRVAQLLRGNIQEEIHNHHNFAWRERHFDKDFWVVRKGATPAFRGQKGFVGGSMGDISVILEGIESDRSKQSLYSTVHGAGRVMGRNQAKGKRDRRTGKKLTDGLISRQSMDDWIKGMGVELRGADVDEAPQAYKRIDNVLYEHRETIKILHTLTPIGVCMADDRNYDPYKD